MEEGIYFYRQDMGFYFALKKLTEDVTLIQNVIKLNEQFIATKDSDKSAIFVPINDLILDDFGMLDNYLSKVGDISDLIRD